MKYPIAFFCCLILGASCGDKKNTADHAAYHNPMVQPYTDSIDAHPEIATWYFERAKALSSVNEDSLCLADLQQAVKLDSLNPQYVQALGNIYLELEQPAQAITAFRKNLLLSPGDARVRLLLSKAYLENKNEAAAQQEVEKVLAAAPNYPDALYWQAKIKYVQKDTTAAINLVKQALAIDSGYYQAAYQLADWYASVDIKAAIPQYEKTFRMDTLDVSPLFEIGELYKQRQQLQQAKEAYRVCILKDPDYTDAYIETGKILALQDSTEKALRQFLLAIQTRPGSAEAYLNKGLCYEKLKQRDSAIVALRQALVFKPGLKAAQEALLRLK
ncbi:tetratricopeptide repeat protein [Taibaiella chishuiensis]|uniref:Tetratricopeptide repeat protein n=1 Tax=Taibaiella chishuiensis TaxID=1434707 RepID=A0A2P8DBH9_9BACT|nr:tetratricopeptide repeat protein [Taibaiella chishuiensis]PSK94569.1 tetratricopeptide repeat protein [Taibaiella chishuiensis]